MRNALLALVMLTQLDGAPIWVESTAIVIVRPSEKGPHQQCNSPAGSAISVAGRGLCVKEPVEQIRQLIRDAR